MFKTYKTEKEARKHLKKNQIIIKVKNGFAVVDDIKSISKLYAR